MTFKERNEAWHGQPPREFRQLQTSSGNPRVWSIYTHGNAIVTSWGFLGGAMQGATEHCQGVNLGKKNEKSPELYAVERAREMCRKVHWSGYREWDHGTGQFLDEVSQAVVNFGGLPLELSFWKPQNSMSAKMDKLARAGDAFYVEKANGMMMVLCVDDVGLPHFYSRRMLRQHDDEQGTPLTWDDRFAFLINETRGVLPPRTILLGELIVVDQEGKTRFDLAQSYIKSLTAQALTDMKTSGLVPFYNVWDCAFLDGEDLVREGSVAERLSSIQALVNQMDSPWVRHVNVWPSSEAIREKYAADIRFMEETFRSPEDALDHAKARKMEGFVVVDPDGTAGDKAYNFKGKPDRPTCACKLKPSWEDDFVAWWDPEKGYGERSTKGRTNQGIKSVALYQYDKNGQMQYISNVASGLSDQQKTEWARPDIWPKVFRVEYTDRRYKSKGDDTNALDFARFDRERTDKLPFECINPEL